MIIYGKHYSSYVSQIINRLNERNNIFQKDARRFYKAMDDLYLRSLDPMQRELILMRREQAEFKREQAQFQKQMQKLEMDRQRRDKEVLEENRRTRLAQERLLDIEERREARNGYR